jgi:hypothetical protein
MSSDMKFLGSWRGFIERGLWCMTINDCVNKVVK